MLMYSSSPDFTKKLACRASSCKSSSTYFLILITVSDDESDCATDGREGGRGFVVDDAWTSLLKMVE